MQRLWLSFNIIHHRYNSLGSTQVRVSHLWMMATFTPQYDCSSYSGNLMNYVGLTWYCWNISLQLTFETIYVQIYMYVERLIIRFNERTKILSVHWHATRAPRQHWMSIKSSTQCIATHTPYQLWKTKTKANACHRKPSWGLWTHKQTATYSMLSNAHGHHRTLLCQVSILLRWGENRPGLIEPNLLLGWGGFRIIMASGQPNPTSSMFDGCSWRLSGTCKALTTFCNLQDWWWLNGYHHQGWVKGHQVDMTCNVV